MAELDRRLRLAARTGREKSGDHDVEAPAAEVPHAEPASRIAFRERDKEGVEALRTAVGPAPEKTPEFSVSVDGGGDEPGPVADEPLPSVEELSQRLPSEVRTVLEELFRAQWTAVRRLRPEDLRK